MKEKLDELVKQLGPAHDASDIKRWCEEHGQTWGYSLVTSAMEKSAPLILGFNWGANKGAKYPNQESLEVKNLEIQEVGSLNRIFPFVRHYFGEEYLSKASQSNYCFFRSKTESQITPADIERCRPVFIKLIEILEPSAIICLSAKLRKHLLDSNQVSELREKVIKFKRGSRLVEFVACRGTFTTDVDIKFLPHPNFPMTRDARLEAWKFCCEV